MNDGIKALCYERASGKESFPAERFGINIVKNVIRFHQSFPEYGITPLVDLKNLAAEFGVAGIHVKDESCRFGLNAFKALGGSYSVGAYIADRLGIDFKELTYQKLISSEVRRKLGEITFVTATDGNHGRGIAWIANRLGHKSVVYMPKGSAEERLNNIKALGSEASITDMNYDDAVRLAKESAEKFGWVLVQDTAWEGYETIPVWIMQGYLTMAYEAAEQLQSEKPTHIFLQAGVGAMAGAVTAFFADYYRNEERPVIVIVEPDKADCFFRTARENDGKLHMVKGDMDTIMAGLACGEPCTIGWDILSSYANHFVSIPDYIAAKGMRVLGNPLGDDKRIISGESGAATLGMVAEIMQNDSLHWLKQQLGLDGNSRLLFFSTEGDTDRRNYRQIVWDGLHKSL